MREGREWKERGGKIERGLEWAHQQDVPGQSKALPHLMGTQSALDHPGQCKENGLLQ